MIELRLLRPLQHQPDSAAIEERQSRRRFEKELQSQLVFIKGSSPFHVSCIDGDLPEAGNSDSRCGCAHGLDSWTDILNRSGSVVSMERVWTTQEDPAPPVSRSGGPASLNTERSQRRQVLPFPGTRISAE